MHIVTPTYTFAFIDLAGFTALTDAHGDQAAANQITRFITLAKRSLVGSSSLVNVIGDAVLFAADIVEDGVASTLALLDACTEEPSFPLARGGVHTGSAVRNGDDYVGAGVNVAARITALAAAGEVMLSSEPARAARALGLRVHHLGIIPLRNVTDHVELYRVDLDCTQQAVDPVCRMTVVQRDAAGMLTFGGHDYWFCSLECAGAFAVNPARHQPADFRAAEGGN